MVFVLNKFRRFPFVHRIGKEALRHESYKRCRAAFGDQHLVSGRGAEREVIQPVELIDCEIRKPPLKRWYESGEHVIRVLKIHEIAGDHGALGPYERYGTRCGSKCVQRAHYLVARVFRLSNHRDAPS